MSKVRVILGRVTAVFSRRRRDAGLDTEIEAHLDALIEDYVRRGMSLRDARAAARREFGGIDQMKEAYRDQATLPILETMTRDVHQALRNLRRSPLVTTVALVTLALGMGAMTAVFAVVYGVLLRPLPFPNASRLVQVVQTFPSSPSNRSVEAQSIANLTAEQFSALRAASRTLSQVSAFMTRPMNLTGVPTPVAVNASFVSVGLFEVFGVRPILGRTFRREEEPAMGAGSVVVLSFRAWTRWFGRDPAVVGSRLLLNNLAYPVVGIMPDGFNFPAAGAGTIVRNEAGELDDAVDVWVPWAPPASGVSGGSLFPSVASLAEATTVAQATAEVAAMLPPLPGGRRPARVEVIGLRDRSAAPIKPTLLMFEAAVVFVLLIAAANVANLLLARANQRRRELAIRLALGASRWQAARESLTECVLLALVATALGSFLTAAVIRFVRAFPPGLMPELADVRIDWVAMVFALTLSVAIGAAIAVFVSVRVLRAGSCQTMSDDRFDFSRGRPSRFLVVGQVAAAMVLVCGAGLLLNSFVRLATKDMGFDARNVLAFRVMLTPGSYNDAAARASFYTQYLDALATTPTVDAVAAGSELPFQQTRLDFYPIVIEGRPAAGSPLSTAVVTAGYFRTFHIPIVRGREFSPDDRAGAPIAIVVSQAFASRYFGSTDPIGRQIQVAAAPPAQIVGVAANVVRNLGLVTSGDSPGIYFCAPQMAGDRTHSPGALTVAVHVDGDPIAILPAVRSHLQTIDPALSIYAVATVPKLISEQIAQSRLYGLSAAACAATAMFLAVIGLFGVVAYTAGSRTHEWGIRMALGADAREIVRHVVIGGLRLTVTGVAFGLLGSWMTSRSLQTLLFGVTRGDPATFTAVTILFLAVAMIACYLPARRASRVDPVVALRHD